MTRRPIFVVGSSRSGTTLVARMLGRHTDIHTVRELHFVEELWQPGAADGLTSDQQQDLAEVLLHRARVGYNLPLERAPHRAAAAEVVAGLTDPTPSKTDVLWAVLDHETRSVGAHRPCEQTPRNVFYVEELLAAFPDARVVALVRDPRDVLLSMKNWWKRGRLGSSELTWRTTLRRRVDYHPVFSALLWRATVRALIAASRDERVLVVRFEDLVADPSAERDRLAAHVGVEPSAAMLDVERISSSNADDEDGAVSGIDAAVAGRGTRDLPSTERWIVQRLARPEMARFAYPPVASPLRIGGGIVVALTLVPKVAAAFVANVRRARSPWSAVRRRLRA